MAASSGCSYLGLFPDKERITQYTTETRRAELAEQLRQIKQEVVLVMFHQPRIETKKYRNPPIIRPRAAPPFVDSSSSEDSSSEEATEFHASRNPSHRSHAGG
ncbi:MAG: hypothetical protein IPN42_18515 [Methylococcaceae bacterium]|nr:hypothetical protein [Methylococcaceae bacterium]